MRILTSPSWTRRSGYAGHPISKRKNEVSEFEEDYTRIYSERKKSTTFPDGNEAFIENHGSFIRSPSGRGRRV